MSLNNHQMLPMRTRNMRQMTDVLNAEDVVLGEIEKIINEMYGRALLLHEELVNEEWLQEKLEALTGGIVHVAKTEGMLHIGITVNVGKLQGTEEEKRKTVVFINKWLPAHLAYDVVYERVLEAGTFFSCLWQHDEMFILSEAGI